MAALRSSGAHGRRVTATIVGAVLAGGLSIAAGTAYGTSPAVPSATTSVIDYTWKPVTIGGGGNVSGIDIADDGTVVARVDVYGGYLLRPKAKLWQQLVTTAAMPQEWHVPKLGKGLEEIAIAPSDSDRVYFMFAGHLFASEDAGTSFVETAYAPTNWDSNGDFGRGFGDRMSVDPANPDVVYAGAPNTPLRATDDGGLTWADTAVPAGARHARIAEGSNDQILSVGITGVAFDRSSAVVDGRTSTAYAASWGNGVYRTIDGGATWDLIGGPTAVEHASIDSEGRYFAVHGDQGGPFGVSMYDGEWHDITPAGWDPYSIASVENPFIAADPQAESTVVVGYAKQMFVTRDSGTTWKPMTWSDGKGDVTWADATGAKDYYLVASDLVFDPSVDGRMWLSTGSGVQYADLGTTETIVWHERTKGIESMVATDVATTSAGPVFGVFDFGQFGGSRSLDSFALKKGPVPFFSGTTSLAASPFASGFVVSATTDYVQYGRFPISSSYSTNAGRSWTRFPTMPKGATSAKDFGYGTMAVSATDNIIWAPGRYYPTETSDFQPYVTTNRGKTWSPVVLPGVTSYPADSIGGFMFGRNRQTVVADQVKKGTFYIYMDDVGVFRSTDRGLTWTKVRPGNFSAGQPGSSGLMQAMPGRAGTLFYTDGSVGGHDWQGPQQYGGYPFYRSADGGATWTTVPGLDRVMTFGFGAPARGKKVATMFAVGSYLDEYGIWTSTNDGATWSKIGDSPYTLDWITTISGDVSKPGLVYVGFAGSSFVYGTPTPPAKKSRS